MAPRQELHTSRENSGIVAAANSAGDIAATRDRNLNEPLSEMANISRTNKR
jgi:hypothetical protein